MSNTQVRVWDGMQIEYEIPAARQAEFAGYWANVGAGEELPYYEHLEFARNFDQFEVAEALCIRPWPVSSL
jgi:hypothetical protein